MAITFIGSGTQLAAGSTSANTVTFTSALRDESNALISALVEGDLVVLVWGTGSTADRNPTAPTGYTERANLYSDNTEDTNLVIWTKFMGATPDTTVDVPGSGAAADARVAHIYAFRGVDATTPLDVAVTTATGTGTGQPNPPAITPATAGAWIVVAGASGAATGANFDAPADLSATTNHWRTGTRADTHDATCGTGLKTDWASGAFDPAAWTGGTTGAGDSWAAATLALRPIAATTHATTGALTGQIGSVAGSAAHIAIHATTGALAGPGAAVAGSASSATARPSSGALVGPGATVAGSAARTRAHETTAVLAGLGAAVAGTARLASHSTAGALSGPGAALSAIAIYTPELHAVPPPPAATIGIVTVASAILTPLPAPAVAILIPVAPPPAA